MWEEAGCRDNPADILSRKRNHLNVKKINPVSTQTVHSGEIEVKYNRIQRRSMNLRDHPCSSHFITSSSFSLPRNSEKEEIKVLRHH